MTEKGNYRSVCIAAILVLVLAGVSVSAAGQGKLAVPGSAKSVCYGGSGDEGYALIQQTTDGGFITVMETESTDGDVSGNHGGQDIWVLKFNAGLDREWDHCYGGTARDYPTDIQQTTDGGYILIGVTGSNDGDVSGHHGAGGVLDAWVVKLNQTGGIQWQKCLGGSNTDHLVSVQQTVDGGFVLVGETNSPDGDVSGLYGSSDIWVVKLNADGTILWQKCFGGSDEEYGYFIQQTPDRGYILFGGTISHDGDARNNHDSFNVTADIWVGKLSDEGMLQWQRCLGGSSNDYGYHVRKTTDGGYIIIGTTISNDGDVSGYHGGEDAWVVKLNQTGGLQWQRSLGGSDSDAGVFIQQTTDGGYLLIGFTKSDDGDVVGHHGAVGTDDAWVVKLDGGGQILWQRCLGGSNYEVLNSLHQTSDEGYILVGYTRSDNGDVSGHHGAVGNEDVWVVKLDASGQALWQRCLGGISNEGGDNIRQTTDGGYLLTGTTSSNDGDVSGNHGTPGTKDFWVVKLFGPPTLDGIAPVQVTGGTNPLIVLTGENLLQNSVGPTVTLIKPGTPDVVLTTTSVSPDGRSVSCQPGAGSLMTPGVYSARLMTPDHQYFILPDALTVTCGPAPTITSIAPVTGTQGAYVPGVVIKGTKFWSTGGVMAYLNRTGQPNITTSITGVTTTQITCNVLIPAGTAPGKWNLVVRNPDGQYAVKKDAFTVSARVFKPPRVSSVTPRVAPAGQPVFMNGIAGSFFNASASVTMTGPRGLSIPVSNVTVLSTTKITCEANLTTIPKGYATVTVMNPDGKKATRARAFLIK